MYFTYVARGYARATVRLDTAARETESHVEVDLTSRHLRRGKSSETSSPKTQYGPAEFLGVVWQNKTRCQHALSPLAVAY